MDAASISPKVAERIDIALRSRTSTVCCMLHLGHSVLDVLFHSIYPDEKEFITYVRCQHDHFPDPRSWIPQIPRKRDQEGSQGIPRDLWGYLGTDFWLGLTPYPYTIFLYNTVNQISLEIGNRLFSKAS
jgi:hypothetical protein